MREPLVDAESQKKMLQMYYKKEEEQKKLEADNDDSYLNAAWADSKQMKNQLQGTSGFKWKFWFWQRLLPKLDSREIVFIAFLIKC